MAAEECPVGAVDKALELASKLQVAEIPLDFDPADLQWDENLQRVAEQFSNHDELLEQLDRLLAGARPHLDAGCDYAAGHPGEGCGKCGERWLAGHHLWAAALEAAEKAYQRWLALRALREASAGRG